MMELDDCGREMHLANTSPYRPDMEVTVQMVIKAPRGTMVLFDVTPILRSYWNGYDSNWKSVSTEFHIFPKQVKQCEAIKAFMKEHSHD